jgi:hypothetical protein
MSVFSKLFGKAEKPASAAAPEHAVIVHFDYGSTNLQPIFALERELEEAIVAARAGEYDGNEVAVSGKDGCLYMYGPDADRLFAVVKPILDACTFTSKARIKLRYGPPKDGVRESNVQLGS